MEFALDHPTWRGKEVRPIIGAIRMALQTTYASYYLMRSNYRVDEQTGQPIKKAD